MLYYPSVWVQSTLISKVFNYTMSNYGPRHKVEEVIETSLAKTHCVHSRAKAGHLEFPLVAQWSHNATVLAETGSEHSTFLDTRGGTLLSLRLDDSR